MPATTPCARSPSAWDAPLPCDTSPRLIPIWCFEPWRRGGPIPFARSSCRRPIRCSPTATPRACKGLSQRSTCSWCSSTVSRPPRSSPTTCCPSPARWSARFCRCTAASPTLPTEGRRLWLPTTSAGATTTCSASWDVVWGRPSSGPRRRSRTRLRRSFYLQGFPGRSSASRAPTGPGPPTRSMRRSERMGVRSDSPRRRAESSSQASFCLSTAAAACPSPCLGVLRLLAAPSRSSPALADSRIMLPCTSRIRAFVMGRQHRRQR